MTDGNAAPVERAPVSRREFVGAAGLATLVGLAGCFAPGDPATPETTLTVRDTATGEERTPIDAEEVDLGHTDHYYWEFTLADSAEVTYQVDVLRGEDVHIYIVTPDEYETLAEDEAGFEAIAGSISTRTYSATKTVSLDSGDYRLVVSNADILPENA